MTYVNGNNGDKFSDEDHYNFKYVPDVSLSAGIAKHLGQWSIALNATYRGSTKSIIDGINSSIIADMTLNYRQQLSHQSILSHQLVIRNLFDEQVTVPEYARRRNVEELPLRYERAVAYEVTLTW